jgi:carboxylesterase
MDHIFTYDRHPLRAAVEVARAGEVLRKSGAVSRVSCPALVLHGRHDHVCSYENANFLARRLGSKNVTLRVFEKSAHVLAWDAERDAVCTEVVAFVGKLARH